MLKTQDAKNVIGIIKNIVLGKEYKNKKSKSIKWSFTTWLDPAIVISKITEETKKRTIKTGKKN